MRFIVFGAGAVGGVVGGRLTQSGHDVLLIARGRHYDAIRANGLVVESPEATATVKLPVVNHPTQINWAHDDVVLMAMKTQDSEPAIESLAMVAPQAVPIVSLQNGVANEPMALRRFPNVYGICVMCPTSHLTPGTVQAWSTPTTGLLDIGRYPAGVDETARRIASALSGSTFQSEPRADIMRWKYGKLLMNLGNAIEALCGQAARQSVVTTAARQEAIACFDAAGIPYVDEDEDTARRKDYLKLRPIGEQRRLGGSTWQSLERSVQTIETDYLNGEIVLLGRRHGIPTPANTLLQLLAREAAFSGARPGAMSIEDLEQRYRDSN